MGSDLRLFIPIEKIDREKRTVSGWATTEDVDKQNEVVDYGASKDAFGDWSGNIREMHEPKAVGRAIDVKYDDDNRRVYVTAKISRGSSDTWEKIKDGTLRGFSIGGQTIDKTTQIVKDTESGESRQVNRITKYKLNELSLVDNPANPEAQFELVKSVDGQLRQTPVIEEHGNLVVTELKDILEEEISDYREKADGLIKKVLTGDALEKLDDTQFGVIRKYKSPEGANVTERLFPMPDKVHAHAALKKLSKYSLSQDEIRKVHDKAKEILGSSHTEKNCTACSMYKGGNTETMALSKSTLAKLSSLLGKIHTIVKQDWEDPNPEVNGAKQTPRQTTESEEDPSAGIHKEDGDWEDPNTEVGGAKETPEQETESHEDPSAGYSTKRYTRKRRKAVDAEEDYVEDTEKADMDSDPDSHLRTQDPDGSDAAPVTKRRTRKAVVNGEEEEDEQAAKRYTRKRRVRKQDEEEEEDTEKADMDSDPDSHLRTQDPDGSDAAPVTKRRARKQMENEYEEDEDVEKQEQDDEEDEATAKRYTRRRGVRKQEEDEEEDEESVTKTVLKELQTLNKRISRLEGAPMPRKYRKIEKNAGGGTDSDAVLISKTQDEIAKAQEDSRVTGRPVPAEIEKKKEWLLNKMLDRKFGSNDMRKV